MKSLVVCPTYGRLPYLGRLLSSFLHQKYDDKHLVIINDDKNIKICCEYSNVTCININKKIHVDDKRNIGASFGNYDLIFPLDDDDVFLPDHISNHVSKYMLHGNINLYRNQICYVVYGDVFRVDHSTPNVCSYKKKAWYSVGGYSHYSDNSSGDMVFYNKMTDKMVERDESNLNFVYNFGGLNYHLTCAEDRDIIKIAQAQLHDMQLLGGEFHIHPDDEEYGKFLILDKIYKAEQQDIKIKHVSDAKINISHV